MTGGCVMILLVAPALLSAQVSYGLDLALASRYEWRGITRHDGWVVQPDVLISLGRPARRLTAGVWGNVQLAAPDSASGIGLGRSWLGELNAWTELAGVVGPVDVAAGWTSYVFPQAASAVRVSGGLHDTQELYAHLELLSLPVVVPRLAIWYDVSAVKGAYLEGALTVRVPAWTQVFFPVGSLFLTAAAGYSAGQEMNPNAPGQAAYFARRGFTHLDLSAAIASAYLPVGALKATARLEYHVQIGWDPRVRIASGASGDQRVKTWLSVSVGALGPQCRPSQGVCPR